MPHRLREPVSGIFADAFSTVMEFGMLAGYLLAGAVLIALVLLALIAKPIAQVAARLVRSQPPIFAA